MVQEHRSLIALAAACGAALLLGGCPAPEPRTPPADDAPRPASGSGPILPPPAAPSVSAPARPPPPPRENHLSPATRSLVKQAHEAMAHGDFDTASSTLDRALRIEPNSPLLWVERGRLRLEEKDLHQAKSCGRKALQLASGDPTTQAQAGRLLADALRAQKRNPEAIAVERAPYMR